MRKQPLVMLTAALFIFVYLYLMNPAIFKVFFIGDQVNTSKKLSKLYNNIRRIREVIDPFVCACNSHDLSIPTETTMLDGMLPYLNDPFIADESGLLAYVLSNDGVYLSSVGPDGARSGSVVDIPNDYTNRLTSYDPTNGIISNGDLLFLIPSGHLLTQWIESGDLESELKAIRDLEHRSCCQELYDRLQKQLPSMHPGTRSAAEKLRNRRERNLRERLSIN